MTIPRLWKWLVGIIGSIGTLITGTKSILETSGSFWRDLNPWHVTFILFALLVLALLIASLVEKLDARFAAIEKKIADRQTETAQHISSLSTQFDTRIGNIWQEFDGKLTKEINSRAGGEVTDRNRMSALEERLGKLEA